MDKVTRLSAAQRRDLFTETAARLGMTPVVVEKDFWGTWCSSGCSPRRRCHDC